MKIRFGEIKDIPGIRELYQIVARQFGGIARLEHEITEEYIRNFVESSISKGLILVAEHPENEAQLVGEIHAYKPGPSVFDHVFSELTIAVHPEFQGRKLGRTLFTIFQEEIALNRPDIGRVELITRESNEKALRFYQSIGFTIEGRLEMRIRTEQKTYEADIPMSWQNPNFEF